MSEFENPNLPENLPEKRIEVVTMRVGDIKTGFGNPRKIGKKKREELKHSLEQFGDFGLFLIDEQDNVIAGNMRHAILNEINPDQEVTCKRLVGYTEAELRAINIKDNTHAGEWDMDLLADWTADLNMDLGLDLQEGSPGERKIKEMELLNYEKYDYVMIVCKNEMDYNELTRRLGIDGARLRSTIRRKSKQGRCGTMNQDYQACKTVGIYVPSYKRSDRIMTWNVLNDCTYVVRESEEAAYRKAGITKILTAPDEEINSLAKVRQWIIDNTPEDIVIQCDDDISRMIYKGKNNKVEIADKDVIDMEFERVAQILSDLRLGFASCTMTGDVRKFNAEFLFKGITGGICWFNKECLKSRFDNMTYIKEDTDFVLQELLQNRIIIIPDYFGMQNEYDKNAGGNNENKNSRALNQTVEYMKNKWGKYYDHNFKTNQSRINVKR